MTEHKKRIKNDQKDAMTFKNKENCNCANATKSRNAPQIAYSILRYR